MQERMASSRVQEGKQMERCVRNKWNQKRVDVEERTIFFRYVQGIHANSWKGAGKMTLDTLRGHGKAVLAIDASGDRLVSGGEDKKIRVWSVSKRRCLTTLRGHGKSVLGVRRKRKKEKERKDFLKIFFFFFLL